MSTFDKSNSSIFNKKINELKGSNSDFEVSTGMHQAVCVSVCYLGDIESVYKGETKVQSKFQLYFAVQDGEKVKTILSKRYTLSFSEMSAISKDLKTWKAPVDNLNDFLGKTASLVVTKDDKYTNIQSILPAQGETDINLTDVFIPKFWVSDREDQPTGYDIITADGVGERPLTEEV